MTIDRNDLIEQIRRTVPGLSWITAAWRGGADATGRVDALSDVDLQLVVEDDMVEEAFVAMEEMLGGSEEIEHRWRVAEPTWHGHAQAVYRQRGAPGHLFLDLLVIRRSAGDWFSDRERHGESVVLLDREGLLGTRTLDRAALDNRRQALLAHHARSLPVVVETVAKSIRRGNMVEASIGYHRHLLRPLIDLMRCEHCPDRFDFGARYLDRDLPVAERELLEELAVSDGRAQLEKRFQRARRELEDRLERLSGSNSERASVSAVRSP
ncbi:MAG: hypothetical protein MK085_11010 [Phycisphaerales bacterium]|nr:hypothetical protein [Phycisphaerales bacterium]